MDQLLHLRRCLLLLFLLTGFCFTSFAQVLKGTVSDKQNGDPMIGATVSLKNDHGEKLYTSVGLDGSFIFRNVPPGNYEVEAKYVSYKDKSVNVEVRNDATPIITILLESKSTDLREVTVAGTVD